MGVFGSDDEENGISGSWISLMMMCVNTVSYLVLINGEPKGRIAPSRGLRQGDPISLYLFLLCAEGLSAMLQRDEVDNNLRGISMCRGLQGFPIYHLRMIVLSSARHR